MSLFNRLLAGALAVGILLLSATAFTHDSTEGVSPEDALARLKSGNTRFIKGKRKAASYNAERVLWKKTQKPYAIILCCSDSRVAPEILFDESLGQLFVIRVAGNVVDSTGLGSIEYAAEHLGANLIVVLGHESCGAVKATLDGGETTPNIASILNKIKPAIKPKATLDNAVEQNVALQKTQVISNSQLLHDMVAKKSIAVAAGVYHFNGTVSWLP